MPLLHQKKQKKAKKGKKEKTDFSKARIEEIRKEFNELRYKYSELKIKEIRKNLYEIENEKNLFESKIKEIEKDLTELEENLSKTKSTMIIMTVSIDEDYYKPIIANSAFDGNYIQCESKGGKGKNLSIKKYLNIIKSYLIDVINKHKTHDLVRYHSDNKS